MWTDTWQNDKVLIINSLEESHWDPSKENHDKYLWEEQNMTIFY